MHRFYCPNLPEILSASPDRVQTRAPQPITISDFPVRLDPDQTHHACRVLRLGVGLRVEVFDGLGMTGQATIAQGPTGARGCAVLRLMSLWCDLPVLPAIDVAMAVAKGPRGADVVATLSQLGANRFIPLCCHRGTVDPRRINRRRFERAAIESARQCGRAHVLTIEPPSTLEAMLDRRYDVRLIGVSRGPSSPIECHGLSEAQRVLVLIGPEGGWSNQERTAALAGGCSPWRFGPHVMRIETACAAAVSIVRYLVSLGS